MRLLGLVAAAALATTASAHAQTPTFNEQEVKAVFLFNFAQFVEWPPEAFADRQAPFVIGVLGEDPFGHVLDDVVKGEAVKRRRLVVERYRRVEAIRTCHILFVSASETQRYEYITTALQKRAILTVGDGESFSSRGGMIRFLTDRNRIRLRINAGAAKAAGLIISSRLLRTAESPASERTP